MVSRASPALTSIRVGSDWLIPEVPPAAAWASKEGRSEYSSVELDEFHQRLLLSDDNADLMHGLLSVVFWGNVSGKDSRIKAALSLSGANALIEGRVRVSGAHAAATPESDIVDALRSAQAARSLFFFRC